MKEARLWQNTIKYNSHDFKTEKERVVVDKEEIGGKEGKYNVCNKINNRGYHLKQNQKGKLEEN